MSSGKWRPSFLELIGYPLLHVVSLCELTYWRSYEEAGSQFGVCSFVLNITSVITTISLTFRFPWYLWVSHDIMTSSNENDFPRYWPFVRGIHWFPVNSSHKGQWRGSLTFSFRCVWTNGWVSNRNAGDLRRHRTHYDVTSMELRACTDLVYRKRRWQILLHMYV